jgi:hypothetical protein
MSEHGKVRVHRCPVCRVETVRRLPMPPGAPFPECPGCGVAIDWTACPVEDHRMYLTDLLARLRSGDFRLASE